MKQNVFNIRLDRPLCPKTLDRLGNYTQIKSVSKQGTFVIASQSENCPHDDSKLVFLINLATSRAKQLDSDQPPQSHIFSQVHDNRLLRISAPSDSIKVEQLEAQADASLKWLGLVAQYAIHLSPGSPVRFAAFGSGFEVFNPGSNRSAFDRRQISDHIVGIRETRFSVQARKVRNHFCSHQKPNRLTFHDQFVYATFERMQYMREMLFKIDLFKRKHSVV